MIRIITVVCLMVQALNSGSAQPTFSKDVASIIFNHCTTCHRQGEIGPMALTNYEQVKNWASTIRYVTSNKIMPPWKADEAYSRFVDENYLSSSQVKTISDWVNAGSPLGNASETPKLPQYPTNSLLGTPDLILPFKRSYVHKGNGTDEYRYFVIPTGITEAKKVKAVELRPGNKKIVHHSLFFADQSGKAKEYDDKTPEYGFSVNDNADFRVTEVINHDQFPGYVPGQKPRNFPDGLAQILPANSDLVIQMHYAPWSVDEADSSTVNIFFAKENEIIDRTVKDYIMLPFNLVAGPLSFIIPANQVKKFEGVYTVPADISLVGIFPHMHLLGKNWEVYIENLDGTKTNLIKINDWDFNWQGGYYFDKYKIAKKGSKIHAFATYDNTLNNPKNPNFPLKTVSWGEKTTDEMYYLPLLYVPYKDGDENIVFDNHLSATLDINKPAPIVASLYPNPASYTNEMPVHITFELENGMPVSIDLFDVNGQLVRRLRDNEFFGQGQHIVHLQANHIPKGWYIVRVTAGSGSASVPMVIID
ncbi:MAG: T9SS type A sorting domain-containing protein [Saprospiraceae bacterium]|nr:T9SS type A sorting domain-containing protein [Saprospiraceae bacterium]